MEVPKRLSSATVGRSHERKDGGKHAFDSDTSRTTAPRSVSSASAKDNRKSTSVAFDRKTANLSSDDHDALESVGSGTSSQPSSTSKPVRVGCASRKSSAGRSGDLNPRERQNGNLWMIGPVTSSDTITDASQTISEGLRGERIRKLQRLSKARDRDFLMQLEEMFTCARDSKKGPAGEKYREAAERLGHEYNVVAMKYLQSGANAVALHLLQGAESVITEAGPSLNLDSLKGLTYNNLGCYFRREGGIHCTFCCDLSVCTEW